MKKLFKILVLVIVAASILAIGASALEMTYTPSESYRNSQFYEALTDVELIGDYKADLVAVALSQVGYKESNSKDKLGGTSQGSSNYTEYGRFTGAQGSAWCASFVSWCARQSRIPEDVVSNSVWATTSDFGVEWKDKNNYIPNKGDLIIFDYPPYHSDTTHPDQHGDHVGIVVDVDTDNRIVYSVEGNSSNNRVQKKSYSMDYSGIKGYGRFEDSTACKHLFNGCGVCKNCGDTFVYDIININLRATTKYKINLKELPYSESNNISSVDFGKKVEIISYTTNCFGNKFYLLRSGNLYGWSSENNLRDITPVAPKVISITRNNNDSAWIKFSSPAKGTTYQVQYFARRSLSWKNDSSYSSGATKYLTTGLSLYQSYQFRVRSWYMNSCSEWTYFNYNK